MFAKCFVFENVFSIYIFCILNDNFIILIILRINNIKRNKRILTFQKLLKSIYYRNNYKIAKIILLLNACSRNILRRCFVYFFAKFAKFNCDFNYNLIRIRSIFNIINFVNKIHFEFQNEFLFIKIFMFSSFCLLFDNVVNRHFILFRKSIILFTIKYLFVRIFFCSFCKNIDLLCKHFILKKSFNRLIILSVKNFEKHYQFVNY